MSDMFERFAPEGRRSIFFAYASSERGLQEIGSEHLLLGLVREDIAFVNHFLNPEIAEKSLRRQILDNNEVSPSTSGQAYSPEMRFTDESMRILSFAADEADQMGAGRIGIDHLLLGLLREHGCFAERVLREHGASAERIRIELATTPYQPPTKENRVMLEINRIPRVLTDAPRTAADLDHLIFFAKLEAFRLASMTVETHHLLLAMLRDEEMHVDLFLSSLDSKETVRKQIEEQFPARGAIQMTSKLPLSAECEQVLTYAEEEARKLGHERVGPGHLILGLLRDEESFVAKLLREHGAAAGIERIRNGLGGPN